MKKLFALLFTLLPLICFAASVPKLQVTATNGAVNFPTNFWSANRALIDVPFAGSYVSNSTNILIDAARGSVFRLVLTNNVGLIITNGFDGQTLTLELYQDSIGNRTAINVDNAGGSNTNLVKFGTDVTGLLFTTNALAMDRAQFRFTKGFGGKTNVWDAVQMLGGF